MEILTSPQTGFSFSGHETFVFRYAWLKKGVDAVTRNPVVFNDDSGMVKLGVGKNMVRSIRHWGLATRVLEEVPRTRGTELQVSELGAFLFGDNGKDPYLEDLNTLWLLHWNLVTNDQKCTTWSWAFSLYPAVEFTRDALTVFIQLEARKRTTKIQNENSLRGPLEFSVSDGLVKTR